MSAIAASAPATGFAPLFVRPGFGRPFKPVQRRRRHPFRPGSGNGPYQLPKAVQGHLEASLAPFRNAEAAFALAVFLARFWSSPTRLDQPFPVDRRALADHRELALTEGQIRGAIQTLERVGFLDRPIVGKGSAYRRKGDQLHRKPVLYVFGASYREGFVLANQRSKAKRQDQSRPGREAMRPMAPILISPKDRNPIEDPVLMGDVAKRMGPEPVTLNDPLEIALQRLKKAIGM